MKGLRSWLITGRFPQVARGWTEGTGDMEPTDTGNEQMTGTSGSSATDERLLAGESLFGQGDIGAAIDVFLSIVAENPSHAGAHSNLGVAYWEIGERGKAMQHLMQAFRIDSGNRTTALNLGKALCENSMFEAATHTLATYLYLNPDDPEVAELMKTCQSQEAAHRAATARQASERPRNARPLPKRFPDENNSLEYLKALGIDIKCILDIGVLHGTPPLMQTFPYLKHYLFEPVDEHFDTIRRNYARLNYELHHVALSNSDGEAWQVGVCIDGTGKITHSQISDHEVTREQNPNLVNCKRIRRARLDTLIADLRPMQPYLLKIDVDGHEIPILEGATETLKNASVVVIEVTAPTLIARGHFLAQHGFQLFDIVDITYYCDVFYQADAVFVRNDIIAANPKLRPMSQGAFQQDRWQTLSGLFKA